MGARGLGRWRQCVLLGKLGRFIVGRRWQQRDWWQQRDRWQHRDRWQRGLDGRWARRLDLQTRHALLVEGRRLQRLRRAEVLRARERLHPVAHLRRQLRQLHHRLRHRPGRRRRRRPAGLLFRLRLAVPRGQTEVRGRGGLRRYEVQSRVRLSPGTNHFAMVSALPRGAKLTRRFSRIRPPASSPSTIS